jgi:ribonuclease D
MSLGVAVCPAVPAEVASMPGLVEWMRRHPAEANAASPGTGTLPHILEVMLFDPAGQNWRHVSYPGGPPALVALLKVLLAAKSEAHNVAPRLLANSDDLDRLATEAAPDVPALKGWRREVFGEAALALKAGRLALGVDGRRVKLLET